MFINGEKNGKMESYNNNQEFLQEQNDTHKNGRTINITHITRSLIPEI
jgi:hypothetical protein